MATQVRSTGLTVDRTCVLPVTAAQEIRQPSSSAPARAVASWTRWGLGDSKSSRDFTAKPCVKKGVKMVDMSLVLLGGVWSFPRDGFVRSDPLRPVFARSDPERRGGLLAKILRDRFLKIVIPQYRFFSALILCYRSWPPQIPLAGFANHPIRVSGLGGADPAHPAGACPDPPLQII